MVRELRRLLIAPERLAEAAAAGALTLTAPERRYLERVLRLAPGGTCALVDGAGHLWSAELQAGGVARLLQPLAQPLQRQEAPAPVLVLAAAVVKRDFEVVVRMAVELGVDRLVPLLCERTAVQGQLRPERWRTIAAEAAEQCERLWLPCLEDPVPVAALLDRRQGSPGLWATTRLGGRTPLPAALRQLDHSPAGGAVWLACGPEGGWSEAEERAAAEAGWWPVDLGPRILRSSTACVSALAALSGWRAEQSGC